MKQQRKLAWTLVSLLVLLAMTFSVASAAGGNPFRDLTSTAGGYASWDSDMVNIEKVEQIGAKVYVAVLDTGLVPNWADFFPKERIRTDLGTGFDQSVVYKSKGNPCEFDVEVGALRQTTWVGSTGSTHGTHVASTILGYSERSNFDAAGGFPLPPIVVRGIAPDVDIIPVKVLADYQMPAMPKCDHPTPATSVGFGTSAMAATGIDYVTDLALKSVKLIVINMSLGGSELSDVEKTAIDRVVVAVP